MLIPEPGLTPGLESARCGLGRRVGYSQASGKPGGGGASLTRGAVSGLPKLMLNFGRILSDGTGVCSRSCVTGEAAAWFESRFIY